jgi:hypothetical protein
MSEDAKRVPGVPDRALIKAAGAIAQVDWLEIHDNKVTRLRSWDDGKEKELIAGNNTQLVAQLIAFWQEHSK